MVHPVALSGEATMAGETIDFTLHGAVSPAGGSKLLDVTVKGSHDLDTSRGLASVDAAPVSFRPGGVQPGALFPAAAGTMSEVTGTLSLTGGLRWQAGSVSPELTARLAGIGFVTPAARFDGMTGAITFTSLLPPATPPGQRLTGRVEAAGLPPGEVSVRFHLLPSAVLVVEEASLGFADGTIAVSGLAVDPAAPAFETVLRIENIDLAEVFDLIGVEGLSGSGRLKGTIPLQFTGGGLRIADAVLNAGGPGVLRFKGDEVPKAIRDAGEYAQLTLDALRNFHYESLSLEIDKSAAGEGTIMARLHGHNPDILEGRPFIFNIRLESDFDRLSALVLDGMTAAQALLRRAVTAVP